MSARRRAVALGTPTRDTRSSQSLPEPCIFDKSNWVAPLCGAGGSKARRFLRARRRSWILTSIARHPALPPLFQTPPHAPYLSAGCTIHAAPPREPAYQRPRHDQCRRERRGRERRPRPRSLGIEQRRVGPERRGRTVGGFCLRKHQANQARARPVFAAAVTAAPTSAPRRAASGGCSGEPAPTGSRRVPSRPPVASGPRVARQPRRQVRAPASAISSHTVTVLLGDSGQ